MLKTLSKISGLLLITLLFTGCGWFENNKPTADNASDTSAQTQDAQQNPSNDDSLAQETALSNPATVYCLAQDGEFVMNKTLNGNMAGYCNLPNDITCEVWAFYRGECPETATANAVITELEKAKIADNTNQTNTDIIPTPDTPPPPPSEAPGEEESTSQLPSRSTRSDLSTSDITIKVEPGTETGEIYMSWITDLEAMQGYYVMLSGSENITYPSKYFHKLANPESHAFTWIDLAPEKTYYFRVCIIKDDLCDVYSPVASGTAQE